MIDNLILIIVKYIIILFIIISCFIIVMATYVNWINDKHETTEYKARQLFYARLKIYDEKHQIKRMR